MYNRDKFINILKRLEGGGYMLNIQKDNKNKKCDNHTIIKKRMCKKWEREQT